MDQPRPLIAVLDDEPQFCKALARLLKAYGFEVINYARGEEFLESCASRSPNCLLLDLHMPDINGFEILGNALRVRALGGLNYFLKPVKETELLVAILAAIHHD